ANHTARFSDALRELWQLDDPILLEAGPGRTLSVLAMQHPDRARAGSPTVISSIPPSYESEADVPVLLQAVGQLWSLGAQIRWETLYAAERRRRVTLPTYPFERQEYWIERRGAGAAEPAQIRGRVEDIGIDDWFYAPSWERTPLRATGDQALAPADGAWLVF